MTEAKRAEFAKAIDDIRQNINAAWVSDTITIRELQALVYNIEALRVHVKKIIDY